jgi:hypothetical protein
LVIYIFYKICEFDLGDYLKKYYKKNNPGFWANILEKVCNKKEKEHNYEPLK